MAERRTRGKPSSIETLPEDTKRWIDEMLRDKKFTQKEIVALVNAHMDQKGIDKEITKSSLNRYSTRLETVGAKLRQASEMTNALIARFGDKPTGEVSKLLIATLQAMQLDTTLHLSETDEPVAPKMLNELALSIQRTENASALVFRREKEIRQAFAEQAAAAVEKTVAAAGMSRDTIDTIKREILGIA